MRKLPALIGGVILLASLSACGNSGDASRVGEDTPARGVVTVQYDGKPVDCITWEGSHGEIGLTCDFVKYHMENKGGLTAEEQAELQRLLTKAGEGEAR